LIDTQGENHMIEDSVNRFQSIITRDSIRIKDDWRLTSNFLWKKTQPIAEKPEVQPREKWDTIGKFAKAVRRKCVLWVI